MLSIKEVKTINTGGNCKVTVLSVEGIGITRTIGFDGDCFVGYYCPAEELLFENHQVFWTACSNEELVALLGPENAELILQDYKISPNKNAGPTQEKVLFRGVTINLACSCRIPTSDRKEHLYYYDVRHADDDSFVPATIERSVWANHMGTIATDRPVFLETFGSVLSDEEADIILHALCNLKK